MRMEIKDMEREEIESKIEEARSELLRLSPIYKEAVRNLNEVSKEVGYWSNVKYNLEKRLVKVQRIAAFQGPSKRKPKAKKEPTINELLADITSISSFDKKKLLDALTA